MKKLISIVSPAHNEEKNIPLIVSEIKSVMQQLSDKYDFEYIIVSDGSLDKTWLAIKEENNKDKRVKGLMLSRNFGHQLALTAGLDHAKGELVIYCDSDLQHPPQLFLEMIKKWEEGYKVVHSVRRETEDETVIKRLFSKFFYKVMKSLSDIPINEGMADFKLLDRTVLDKLKLMKEHNRFLRGMVPWLGYESVSVEYDARKRIYGKPWYNFGRNLSFAKKAILSFSGRPLKYISYLGIFITLSSFSLIVFNILWKIVNNEWFLSSAVFLSVFNTLLIGVVLSSIGVIALYLNFVYDEVVNRPLYVISDETGFDDL